MKTLLSIDEFEKLPKPEQGGGYELDEGEPVYVSPNSLEQVRIIYRIYALLNEWARRGNLGLVAADSLDRACPRYRACAGRCLYPPRRLSNLDPKHALKVVPALAVEVLSAYNTAREMSRKIQQYRDAGIELIWVVDPEKCEVDIYSSLPLKTLRQGDTLSDDKILPGFSFPYLVFEPVR